MSSKASLRILIDTNIFVAAESDADRPHPNLESAATLYRLATELKHTLCVGHGTRVDMNKITNEAHKKKRLQQLLRYYVFPEQPIPIGFQSRAGYPPNISDQSKVDLSLLLLLDRGAAQWLVTEDQRILPHARALGVEDRVFSLSDAVEVLSRQKHQPIDVPAVEEVKGFELDRDDPIFDDFAPEYAIRDWLRDKVAAEARPCLVMRTPAGALDAVVILKEEEEDSWGLPGKVLKVCTFKVAGDARGVKRGELLLWAIFEHAHANAYDAVFVEAFEDEIAVVELFEAFGFSRLGSTYRTGEIVLGKHLVPRAGAELAPLEYNVAYGPGALTSDRWFIVPILPKWHAGLFPVADDSGQFALYDGMTDFGNAIRKAYVCRSPCKQLRPGDNLLFLRTRERQMVNVVGVVEEVLRSSDPLKVMTFTGRRTVYSPDELVNMCASGEVLAIRFRLDRVLDTPLRSLELVRQGVMTRSPQSIQQVKNEGAKTWLKSLLVA